MSSSGIAKIASASAIMRDQILLHQENSVIWCINPTLQFFLGAALHLCGIDAHVFHAEPDHFEREMLDR